MTAPLDGVRVVEIGNWNAVPSAAGVLADLGADVIKVEPPGGDPFRAISFRVIGYNFDFQTNYAFQLDNRGKRSITVALDQPGGPRLVRRLIAGADVFITNLIRERRVKYGLTFEDLRAVNPRLVALSFSGYGLRGPDADRMGFDYAAFWARSGAMGMLGEPPSPPPLCRPGQGDHTATLNMVAGVLAALRLRDMTGEAQHVEVTLQRTGVWTLASDVQAALVSNEQPPRHDRTAPSNPIWNTYQCADGRWLLLAMPQADVYWPNVCRAVRHEEWLEEDRYATLASRKEHTRELTPLLETAFAEHDLAWWGPQLDAHGVIWAPVQRLSDVIEDPQLREMQAFVPIEHPVYGRFETLNTPFAIEGSSVGPRGPAPEPGEHTFEVLAELGLGDAEIDRLAAGGVLG
jgi:crotonobetainyl-CoA:carnitine CoA-transferase CaiB-like acyl-CoA transferase